MKIFLIDPSAISGDQAVLALMEAELKHMDAVIIGSVYQAELLIEELREDGYSVAREPTDAYSGTVSWEGHFSLSEEDAGKFRRFVEMFFPPTATPEAKDIAQLVRQMKFPKRAPEQRQPERFKGYQNTRRKYK